MLAQYTHVKDVNLVNSVPSDYWPYTCTLCILFQHDFASPISVARSC